MFLIKFTKESSRNAYSMLQSDTWLILWAVYISIWKQQFCSRSLRTLFMVFMVSNEKCFSSPSPN